MASRECPVDRIPLVSKAETFVTIDECPKCKGAFYERNEAQTALASGADVDLLVKRGVAVLQDGSGHACPGCSTSMRSVRITPGDGAFVIDTCPGCGGLWLDGGEAEKLGRVASDTEAARQSLQRAEDEEIKEHGKGGWRMLLAMIGIPVPEDKPPEPRW